MMQPTIHLEMPGGVAVSATMEALSRHGFRVMRSFDLQDAAAAHPSCACPHHGTDKCTCQYLVLLAYPGDPGGQPLVLAIHSHDNDTFLSLLDGEESDWLGALLPLVAHADDAQRRHSNRSNMEVDMSSKTFTVPNISCGHCTHTIKMELAELPGVKSVDAEVASKQVTVEWDPPATWDQIKATLVEINYTPAE